MAVQSTHLFFSSLYLKRAALSLFSRSLVDNSSPHTKKKKKKKKKIHANLLCHNPHYQCRTTHPALKVPVWDLNPTEPPCPPTPTLQITHRKKKKKKVFCVRVCVCVLVCMLECMCAAARRKMKEEEVEEREQLSEAALAHH